MTLSVKNILISGLIFFVFAIVLITWLIDEEPLLTEQQQKQLSASSELSFPFIVSQGATAGYVADEQCSTCHAGHADTYKHIGMSKSFKRPSAEHFIEDFSLPPYFHSPSKRYYQMQKNGDDIEFMRYQLDKQQQPINVFKRKVDYIIGSGNTTRSYLYQTESGEIFQLPLGWYTQTQAWAMAPGYDNAMHAGVTRPIQRQCLFCHNAFPDVPVGSDLHWQPHIFPKSLPEGIGCQRCHGPGESHIMTALSSDTTLDKIKTAIVNPAKLPAEQRDSVCFQCHLLPSVALTGIRKFNRPDYSFRPGDNIFDYIAHIDITEADKKQSDRFEINHQAYRLRQSECFTQSEGELTCISCHNPHAKVQENDKVKHYRAVCQGCHTTPHGESEAKNNNTDANVNSDVSANHEDCISCHMPKRRTQDVVHVVMTDHRIQRQLNDLHPLATLSETEPQITGIHFLDPTSAPKDVEGEIYKVVTLLRAKPTANYVDYLKAMLAKTNMTDIQPYFDLAQGQLSLKRYEEALTTTSWLLSQQPDNFRAKQWQGTAFIGLNRLDEAMAIFETLIEKQPNIAEIQFNFGLLLYAKQDYQLAKKYFNQASQLRDTMPQAFLYAGLSNAKLGNTEAAIHDHQKVLAIDPANTRAYVELSQLYLKLGNKKAALLYRQHGRDNARQPDLL